MALAETKRSTVAARAAALLAVGFVGCAGLGRPPEPTGDVQGLSPIGGDLRKAKRGTTIPPATFGVDLVEFRPREEPPTGPAPSANPARLPRATFPQ